jgi:hypothetical protein
MAIQHSQYDAIAAFASDEPPTKPTTSDESGDSGGWYSTDW